MNKLLKVINLLVAEREKASLALIDKSYSNTNYDNEKGVFLAFSHAVNIAQLVLSDKPTEAITEAAHSANTMLSEVPTSHTSQVIVSVVADSSEPEIVKQNEQTRKVCECLSRYGAPMGNWFKCVYCGGEII